MQLVERNKAVIEYLRGAVSILNSPAPPGFRLPTAAEWEEERLTWATQDADGAFGSALKLTGYQGFRAGSTGNFANQEIGSYNWSSSVSGTSAIAIFIPSPDVVDLVPLIIRDYIRSSGFSVRCIRDETYSTKFTGGIFNGLEYQLVTSLTGRVWLDRNLGATQVATSFFDSDAYGDLYQWGRLTDGHEKRTSSVTLTLSTTDVPGHGDFIASPNSPFDWRSPQNDKLWQYFSIGSEEQSPLILLIRPNFTILRFDGTDWTFDTNTFTFDLVGQIQITLIDK